MITLQQLQAFSQSMNETDFLWNRRKAAYQLLQNAPASLQLPAKLSAMGSDEIGAAHTGIDGVVADTFGSMNTGGVSAKERAVFQRYCGSLAVPAENDEIARNSAFLTLGMYVHVLPGTRLTVPVEIQFRSVGQWAGTHVVLLVGAGSHCTFVEKLNNDLGGENRGPSGDHTGTWSHVVEVIVEDDATVEYVSLQAADIGSHMCIRHYSSVGQGASIAWRNATIGGKSVDHHLRSELHGDHASSSVDWLAYAKDMESQRLSVRNVFLAREGRGEITMKGVAENKAHVICNGMIDIGRNGQGTQTYLTQEVLMLDAQAKVDAIPGLEIKTNDVKASHSATVSRVTAEDLFYFAARGIAPQIARQMYIQGFLGDLTDRLSFADAKKAILAGIDEKYQR